MLQYNSSILLSIFNFQWTASLTHLIPISLLAEIMDQDEKDFKPDDFVQTWMEAIGQDTDSLRVISMMELLRTLGVSSQDDLELAAPEFASQVPPDTPPVLAYRLFQLLYHGELLSQDVPFSTYGEFSTLVRSHLPSIAAVQPSLLSEEDALHIPIPPPRTKPGRRSEFHSVRDFQSTRPLILEDSSSRTLDSDSWGSLPPLLHDRDREYRDRFGDVDPYAGGINAEAVRIEARNPRENSYFRSGYGTPVQWQTSVVHAMAQWFRGINDHCWPCFGFGSGLYDQGCRSRHPAYRHR